MSFDQNPVFTFPTNAGGTYPISLEVTDFNGCENIVRANVVVHDLFNLFIPQFIHAQQRRIQRRLLHRRDRHRPRTIPNGGTTDGER